MKTRDGQEIEIYKAGSDWDGWMVTIDGQKEIYIPSKGVNTLVNFK